MPATTDDVRAGGDYDITRLVRRSSCVGRLAARLGYETSESDVAIESNLVLRTRR